MPSIRTCQAGANSARSDRLTEALERVDENDERADDASVAQLQGALSGQEQEAPCEQAAASFPQALHGARPHEAPSCALRAATSRARLWQRPGQTTKAHALLPLVYHWLTAGFDTADLKAATAVLAAVT